MRASKYSAKIQHYALCVYAVHVGISFLNSLIAGSKESPGFLWMSLAFLVAYLYLILSLVRREDGTRGTLILIFWGLLQVLLLISGDHPRGQESYPALLSVASSTMYATFVVTNYARGSLLLLTFLISYTAIRSVALPWMDAFLGASMIVVSVACIGLTYRIASASSHRRRRAMERAVANQREAERHESLLNARESADAFLHDKVIAAFSLAHLGHVRAARTLAREALDLLRNTSVSKSTPHLPSSLKDHGTELGLSTRISISEDGSPPPEVVEALLEASREALTNVARHSGQNRVRIVGEVSEKRADITIVNVADTQATPSIFEEGWGVPHGILKRLKTVGGIAEVHQGRRTRAVQLRWSQNMVNDPVSIRLAPWSPSMNSVVVGGALLLLLNLVEGLRGAHLGLWLASLLCLSVVALASLVFLTPDWRVESIVGVLGSSTIYLAALNSRNLEDFIGPLWPLGIFTPMAAVIVYRCQPVVSGAILMLWALGSVTAIADLKVPLISLLDYGPSFSLAVFGAATLKYMMSRLDREMMVEAAYRERVEKAREDGRLRRREWARRVAFLKREFVPGLEALAEGKHLDADLLSLKAAEARDVMSAEAVLNEDLRREIRRARKSGVRVSLTAVAGDTEGVTLFRNVLITVLRAVENADGVKGVWGLGDGAQRATITVLGRDAGHAASAVRRSSLYVREAGKIEIDPIEPEAVLITFHRGDAGDDKVRGSAPPAVLRRHERRSLPTKQAPTM